MLWAPALAQAAPATAAAALAMAATVPAAAVATTVVAAVAGTVVVAAALVDAASPLPSSSPPHISSFSHPLPFYSLLLGSMKPDGPQRPPLDSRGLGSVSRNEVARWWQALPGIIADGDRVALPPSLGDSGAPYIS